MTTFYVLIVTKSSWRPPDVFCCFLKSHHRSGSLNDNIDCQEFLCHDGEDHTDRLGSKDISPIGGFSASFVRCKVVRFPNPLDTGSDF